MSFLHLNISTSFRLLIKMDSFTIQVVHFTISNVHLLQLGANTPEELAEALSDGYVLCELANCLLNDDTGSGLQFQCFDDNMDRNTKESREESQTILKTMQRNWCCQSASF
jgi:hypothetical protein